MTTNSMRHYLDTAVRQVAIDRPDIKVAKTKGVRMGNIRLAQITLEGGAYTQTTFPPLGTHSQAVIDQLVKQIKSLKK
jgi:hypothetical protein